LTTTSPIEPAYVIDTNALIWSLTQPGKLSDRATAVFEAAKRGETEMIVPAIVIAELFYADKKWKLFEDFVKVYNELKAQPYIRFVSLEADDVLDFVKDNRVPEMHDRIIVGVSRRLNVPLVTVDPVIAASGTVRIEW